MTQAIRPNSNVTAWPTGSWASIDETTPSDTDFIESGSNPASQSGEYGLTSPVAPAAGTTTLRVRGAKTGGKSVSLSANLNDSGTPVVPISATALTTSYTELSASASPTVSDWVALNVVVVANASGGGSPATARVSWVQVDAPNPPAPNPPTGLTATPGNGEVDLDWTAPPGDGTVTGFFVLQDGVEVYRSAFTETINFKTITGLTNGTAYDFEVGFLGPGGDSTTDGPVSATPQPGPPTGLTASPGNGEVILDWVMATGATGHKVYRDSVLIDTIGAVDTYTDTSVTNETTYEYEVSTLNGAYESATAGPVSATPSTALLFYPASTVSSSGWAFNGPGSAHLCLDSSLGTYLSSAGGLPTSEVQLPTVTDPGAGATVRIEGYIDTAGATAEVRIGLYSAGILIHEEEWVGLDGAVSYELTSTEFDNITDWSDLSLTVNGSPNGWLTKVMYARLAVVAFAGDVIDPNGIGTAEAFGTAVLTTGEVDVAPSGIATAEAFGTATVTAPAPEQTITVSGIATAEALGSATVEPGVVDIAPTGVATAAAFGTPTLTTGAVEVTVSGIASTEAFGTAVVRNVLRLLPSGVGSAEAFGTASLEVGPVDIAPTGIGSTETFGNPLVSGDGVLVAPPGIESAEALGTAVVTPGAVELAPTGIASTEAFGTATVQVFAGDGQNVLPAGIASTEALGSPTVTPGEVTISPAGIASAEALGDPTVATPLSVEPTGIPTGEVFGTAALGLTVVPAGVLSEEIVGTPTVACGPVGVVCTGIPTEGAFGRTRVHRRHRRILRTPTVQENLLDLAGRPQPWSVDQGISLLKIGGTYHQVRWPTDADIAAATAVYRGGFDHEVDDDEAADLTAAGYGSYIQLIPA